jgi:hypothetical protein
MLIERWAELASQGGGRFLVLVIDEAQGMTQREWLWLVELHSLLEKERIRLCVFSVASLQVFDEPVGMAMSGVRMSLHASCWPRHRSTASGMSMNFASSCPATTRAPNGRPTPASRSRRGSHPRHGPAGSGWPTMPRV